MGSMGSMGAMGAKGGAIKSVGIDWRNPRRRALRTQEARLLQMTAAQRAQGRAWVWHARYRRVL